ncbi:type II toxin-antitoxin system Phd/YefM family antitoxin [Nitrosomonas eutropha]|uniref:Antitoxin n=2 Tax=Nitrosomonas eutropha TaxID=916 RepID=A0ABX5M6Z4_9PROT|nr:prevent-host-death protein [Nitrosomonas eutropha]ABI60044.1 prevent-host-death protein [Nitrosomonas eutropha C91]PXV74337.1 hypothetical protein C8R14_14713 [Nitrosomonas eutropha]SEJ30145.1 hypothetical protein SAMN05216318_1443 [Nitrosomonas eutropha]
MRIYNIHDAKTQLSRLGEQAAKAGKPMAKVVALRASEPSQIKRFDFMAGQIHVPDDFDRMDETEIARLFEEGV